jgi:hypothetical protein
LASFLCGRAEQSYVDLRQDGRLPQSVVASTNGGAVLSKRGEAMWSDVLAGIKDLVLRSSQMIQFIRLRAAQLAV